MPIDPRDYPLDWPVISRRIRVDRAENRCECDGRCGRDDMPHRPEERDDPISHLIAVENRRCTARNRQPSPISGADVVLTTAHLDHAKSNNTDANLMAMCQACHLSYDREQHAESRARTLAARRGSTDAEVTLPGLGVEL